MCRHRKCLWLPMPLSAVVPEQCIAQKEDILSEARVRKTLMTHDRKWTRTKEKTYTPMSLQNTGAACKHSTTQPTAPGNRLHQQKLPESLR